MNKKEVVVISIITLILMIAGGVVSYKIIENKGNDSNPQVNNTIALTTKNDMENTIENTTVNATTNAATSSISVNGTVNFITFDINKKYYNDVNGYVELILKLPKLEGNYNGIPEINKFFTNKEEFFYNELYLLPNGLMKEGQKDGWYRSANYKLEVQFKNIISISADLNGGAGGVSWVGIEGDTFNLDLGKKLELSDIFKTKKDEYMNFIYDYVSKKIMIDINSKANVGYKFKDAYSGDGYKYIREFDPNDFYLSKDGLVIVYQKYALADGASGVLKFVIPYESISNILAIDIKN